MKFISCLAFIISICAISPYVSSKEYNGIVERVIDGDTVVIDGTRMRLIGIDAPELHHPDKPTQCFAEEALKYVKGQLEGKRIKYRTDERYSTQDKYGRLLIYLYDDKRFFNEDMIKKGYALAYKRYPFKYMKRFIRYERKSKTKKLGLWDACYVSCNETECEIHWEEALEI